MWGSRLTSYGPNHAATHDQHRRARRRGRAEENRGTGTGCTQGLRTRGGGGHAPSTTWMPVHGEPAHGGKVFNIVAFVPGATRALLRRLPMHGQRCQHRRPAHARQRCWHRVGRHREQGSSRELTYAQHAAALLCGYQLFHASTNHGFWFIVVSCTGLLSTLQKLTIATAQRKGEFMLPSI